MIVLPVDAWMAGRIMVVLVRVLSCRVISVAIG